MPIRPLNIPIRIVFYREDNLWIAHCLEFDLVGDGETKEEAIAVLGKSIDLQVEDSLRSGNLKNLFRAAPAEVFQKYAQGQHVAGGSLEFRLHYDDVDIPADDFREYEDCDSDPNLAIA